MLFCTECGSSVAETDRFCTNCGHRIPSGKPEGQMTPPPSVATAPSAARVSEAGPLPTSYSPRAAASAGGIPSPGRGLARRDWWIGVGLIVLTLLAHAVIPQYLPRYEFRPLERFEGQRIDRWTGTAQMFRVDGNGMHPHLRR